MGITEEIPLEILDSPLDDPEEAYRGGVPHNKTRLNLCVSCQLRPNYETYTQTNTFEKRWKLVEKLLKTYLPDLSERAKEVGLTGAGAGEIIDHIMAEKYDVTNVTIRNILRKIKATLTDVFNKLEVLSVSVLWAKHTEASHLGEAYNNDDSQHDATTIEAYERILDTVERILDCIQFGLVVRNHMEKHRTTA